MIYAITLGLSFPLLGFLYLMLSSHFTSRLKAGQIACATVFLSFLCFVGLVSAHFNSSEHYKTIKLFPWMHLGSIHSDISLHVDELSLLMALIITGVGFLIHVYSIGYMDHEKDATRYFACLNFFIFAMLLLVMSGSLIALFFGWEAVGLASYLLIGFWYHKDKAAAAATKAFVVNRIGDLGLLLGIIFTFYLFGTDNIIEISTRALTEYPIGTPVMTVLTLLYFWGATGKSAQIPLHTWLPDAMEGPTPVSALIHAATMVTAGVYLVVRLHPIFISAPFTLQVVSVIGGVTALFAALCGLGQSDLKRVLAYSTVSQLGLMFLACGAGAFYAAMFHLTTHAFIKALLFLSAGNVVHMLRGKTEMAEMGALANKLPWTQWLFLLGVLALAGIPPFAAFFSKDLILEEEYLSGFDILYYVGLAASVLTGIYLTRAYWLTFRGASHLSPDDEAHVHEAPKVMIFPVVVLGLLAILGGFLGFSFGSLPILETFLAKADVRITHEELISSEFFTPETIMAIIGAILGIAATSWIYYAYADKLTRPWRIFSNAFYFDACYSALIVRPLERLSSLFTNCVEPKFFEGSIHWAGQAAQLASAELQRVQSGQIRSYVAWMIAGASLLLIYFVS